MQDTISYTVHSFLLTWRGEQEYTWWLDSDSIVTVVNCQQHNDYFAMGSLVTGLPIVSDGIGVLLCRAIASLTVPGGQDFHFPHFPLKFQSIFPQTLLIFFLILALRVGELPTWPSGWATRPPGKALATPLFAV